MHMKFRHLAILSGLLASAPVTAHAQIGAPKVTLFAGAAIPTGDDSDEIKTGYTAGLALDFRVPAVPFGVRAEGIFAKFDAKANTADVKGSIQDIGANLNGVLWFPVPASSLTPYITAGPSFSRVTGKVTGGGLAFEETVNKWGFNAGGGIEFGLGELGARVDVRYKRISMDDGSYESIPITFGIRF
jgi:opacity protein-like surface antigen